MWKKIGIISLIAFTILVSSIAGFYKGYNYYLEQITAEHAYNAWVYSNIIENIKADQNQEALGYALNQLGTLEVVISQLSTGVELNERQQKFLAKARETLEKHSAKNKPL